MRRSSRCRSHVSPIAGVLAVCTVIALGGCTTPAYREVYAQQTASELRTLEDQLYEADYANRVLRDELEQCRQSDRCAADDVEISIPKPPAMSSGEIILSDIPLDIDAVGPDAFNSNRSIESSRIDMPLLDRGLETEAIPRPRPDARPFTPPKSKKTPLPRSPDIEELPFDLDAGEPYVPPTSPAATDPPKLAPAPTMAQPPGIDDLLPPPIIEGDVVPPPSDPFEDDVPAGKVELPDFSRDQSKPFQTGPPVSIRVHPQSGGIDDDLGERFVVSIEAVDANHRTVDLNRFDIDADLIIIVSDPESSHMASDDAVVLGHWEFDAVQTATMIGNDPVSGIHVPIRWSDRQPIGENVLVEVRLSSEMDSLRCQGEVPVKRPARLAAQWLPRGEKQTARK